MSPHHSNTFIAFYLDPEDNSKSLVLNDTFHAMGGHPTFDRDRKDQPIGLAMGVDSRKLIAKEHRRDESRERNGGLGDSKIQKSGQHIPGAREELANIFIQYTGQRVVQEQVRVTTGVLQ